MKEKTSNISILEEMLKNTKTNRRGNKEIKFEVNSNYYTAILTLIAENKELKEKNKELKVINKMQEYRISVIDERELISKSKIEEKIEELSGKVEVGDITREMFNRIEYAIEVLVELLDERSNTDEH